MKHRNWHMDATFKAAPRDWSQCLVLGPSIKRRMVTVVHALMPGKATKYYEEVLAAVRNRIAPRTPARGKLV